MRNGELGIGNWERAVRIGLVLQSRPTRSDQFSTADQVSWIVAVASEFETRVGLE